MVASRTVEATDEALDPLLRAAAGATPDEDDELARVAASLFGVEPVAGFGRYRTVRAIGSGGLGIVYLAHDPELDRPVAIKSIARRLGASTRVQARMRREAQALARLRHPHVVAVHDVGTAGDGVFLAMEYVDGRTLSEWLAEAPRTWQEIARVVAEAGAGLAAAHDAGVVHRDVKPSNILVDRDGRARVVDFGLAFAEREPDARGAAMHGDGLTETGALLGTPAYMAPEQLAGADVDARVDQWGLAVTLHEALVGTRPFVGPDLDALRDAVRARPYVPPPVAASLRAVLVRALQRDPSARFADMHALVAALRPAPKRRPGRLALAMAGASAALGLGALAWWPAHEAAASDAAVQVAELEAEWATPNAVRWRWHAEGRADALRDYQLVTGPSEADVLAASERCRVFTRADNPELGHFLLPRTGGEDPVLATITDEHAPDTLVFAQLVAIDTAGRRATSNVASVHTAAKPVAEIVVFDDERPHGFPMPALALSTARPFAGTHHLQFVSECTPPECFANLRWQDLRVPLVGLTAGDYATTAYLELAVAVDGAATSWWSQLRVWYDGRSLERVGHFNSFALRTDGEYRVLQVPLRAFRFAPGTDGATELGHGLFELGLGGWWPPGALVRIDEVRIRW